MSLMCRFFNHEYGFLRYTMAYLYGKVTVAQEWIDECRRCKKQVHRKWAKGTNEKV